MDETRSCLSWFLLESDALVSRVITRFPFVQAKAVSDSLPEVPEWLIEKRDGKFVFPGMTRVIISHLNINLTDKLNSLYRWDFISEIVCSCSVANSGFSSGYPSLKILI